MRASFYFIAGGFLTGVLWRSFFDIDVFGVTALFVGVVFVFGASTLFGIQNRIIYALLFSLVLLLGIVRTELAYQNFESGKVFTDGEVVSVLGRVVFEPEERDDYTVLVVELDNTNRTRLRVNINQYPEYVYGEKVLLEGEVREPQSFETDTGRVFNYVGYLMKDSIHYQVKKAKVTSQETLEGNVVIARLLELKSSWLRALSRLLPEPSASLGGGVIVGAKRSLGSEWLDAFRDTGIIHIVVLSGYNLTLIANSIVRMTTSLPKGVGFGFGTFGVVGFAMMVGAGATVVRASIMAILGMLSTFLYKPYLLLRALILAGVLMVMWNPFVLAFDPGFQLSFLATAGLIFISPFFEKKLYWITDAWGLRGIVSATFATQLAVFPLLMFQMGRVSLVAPMVNVLILPLVPVVMFTGFVAGLLEMAHMFLSVPFGWFSHVLLSYMFFIVELFDTLPFAAVNLPVMPWWSLILLYALFPLFYFFKRKPT